MTISYNEKFKEFSPEDEIIITQLVEQDKRNSGFYFPNQILKVKDITKFFLENHTKSYRLYKKAVKKVEKRKKVEVKNTNIDIIEE